MESGPKIRPSDQAYFDIDAAMKQRRDDFFREHANVMRERDMLKNRVLEEVRRATEERYTHPVLDNQYNSTERMMAQELLEGKKIAVRSTSEFVAQLIHVGQSYRLTVDEIEELQKKLFEFSSDT